MSSNHNLIFGSMRMTEYEYPISYWVDLFSHMYDLGISTHHVSSEYNSYSYYLEAYYKFRETYPEKKINHLVKLAEPHFGSISFNSTQFEQKLNSYCLDLHINTLWGVQWMWRGNLDDENARLVNFSNDFQKIVSSIESLKKSPLFEKIYFFPYTKSFCEAVFELTNNHYFSLFSGMTIYRNLYETEYDNFLDKFKDNIVIRPLNSGQLSPQIDKRNALKFAMDHENIISAIVSISSSEKLKEILK